ncbi:hypothetical protein CSOJ01_07531 [Colletotrichum sojae]|uniref:DUF7136 domain-containing protein n=1 Tax=Colletotrichum sojae TaxID=2175907 RepID=A0A8H6MU82_9PEZI|nr:hypothetical protein CSOJ01_07531 [Colletotrichum sojae]
MGMNFAVAALESFPPLRRLPGDVEVDLVFPKANETYKLIWPFPIIYATRNASQLWQENYEVAHFSVSWQVSGFPYQESTWTGQKHLHAGSGVWSPLNELGTNHYGDQTVRPDDDVHMRFETLNTNIINGTERMFRLDHSTSLKFACPPNGTVAAKDVSTCEQIVFYLDPESTRLPGFASVASSCSLPVTNFGFTDITWTNYGERCMKIAPTRHSDPCGLKLDAEDLANRTQAAMLEPRPVLGGR